ncbi:MAG: hypothetical protein FIA97_05600 [Methylococcaceae bacterium]|nr:hypothetical protein [Methylococcaceae bacterium]
MNKLLIICVSVLLLGGCSGKEPEPEVKGGQKELYKSVNAPLEKAKGVEDRILQQAEDQKQQIDRQEEP